MDGKDLKESDTVCMQTFRVDERINLLDSVQKCFDMGKNIINSSGFIGRVEMDLWKIDGIRGVIRFVFLLD
ncbi:hypothetical protein L5515_012494 [Caenorhabditis briggsae]|uniref:Uncharacterized protein n=1 Tax=Caenorhabditis briggsae TaxID=6238 RepID=A0AAE9JIF6_CAEBR|nr:hypothetical protein L5515_012494 [Caenorhabditis briggsae]